MGSAGGREQFITCIQRTCTSLCQGQSMPSGMHYTALANGLDCMYALRVYSLGCTRSDSGFGGNVRVGLRSIW